MIKYVLKRLAMLIPIILIISFIVFTILDFTPGDPGRIILGTEATQEDVDALNHELGYDRPFLERYVNYIWDALHGDFGLSYSNQKPVFEDIFAAFPVSLKLSLLAILTAVVMGIPLGVLSAVKQYSIADNICTVLAMVFASVPGFWLSLMLLLLFSLKLQWLPTHGLDTPLHYILPVFTMSVSSAASFMRLTRTSMLETIRQDYVRTARSKGVPESVVITRYALKNALLPVITVIGSYFGILLGGTVLTESVFSLPGLGTLILQAIRMKNVPMVMGATIFLASMFSVIILATDIICAFVDPRVRAKYSKK